MAVQVVKQLCNGHRPLSCSPRFFIREVHSGGREKTILGKMLEMGAVMHSTDTLSSAIN